MILNISRDEYVAIKMQQVRPNIPLMSRASFLTITFFNLVQTYQLNQGYSTVPVLWNLLVERNTFFWITCGVGLGAAVTGVAAELFPPVRNVINTGWERSVRKVCELEYDLAHNEMFQRNSHWVGTLVRALSGQETPPQHEE